MEDRSCGAYCLIDDASYPVQQLSADEATRVLFMREEEKFAMDVYQALSQKWKLRIFSNIAAAEQRHYDAIGTLIIRHDLTDTALPTPGSFTNAELQMLYNDLLAKGAAIFGRRATGWRNHRGKRYRRFEGGNIHHEQEGSFNDLWQLAEWIAKSSLSFQQPSANKEWQSKTAKYLLDALFFIFSR